MKARRSKNFPLIGGEVGDECPVCGSQVVAIGFNKAICPGCARDEIIKLRTQRADLLEALQEPCKYHHCPLSEKFRAAIAKVKKG